MQNFLGDNTTSNSIAIITDSNCHGIVTVSFNSDFVAAGQAGKLIEATGEVVKNTKSLIFVRGEVTCEGETLMPFSGVIKRIGPRNK